MRCTIKLNRQQGLTMLEILVTLSIMSIGLLSMASLQLTGVRSINSSAYRTQASILINDLSERIRANPTAIDNNLFMAVDTDAINCDAIPAPYCGEYYGTSSVVDAVSCNAAQMAAYDLNIWYCGVSNKGGRAGGVREFLPQGKATVTCNDTDPPGGPDGDACTNRSPHTITVSWTEINPNTDQDEATVTQSVSLTLQP